MSGELTNQAGRYVCPVCQRDYPTRHGLGRHFEGALDHKTAASLLISIIRTGIYICPVCRKAGRYDPDSPPGWTVAGWAHPECAKEGHMRD